MKTINGSIIVVTDTHWRYPFPDINTLPFGENVFYLGDNTEFTNFDGEYTEETKEWFLAYILKCIETETNIVKGNHEGGLWKWLEEVHGIIIPMEILFIWNGKLTVACHGLHTWKPKRVQKWFDKPLKPDTLFGSKFAKKMFSRTLAKGRKFWKKTKLSKKQIKRTWHYMLSLTVGDQPEILIMGHIHPTSHIDEKHYDRRMICCMQGETELEK